MSTYYYMGCEDHMVCTDEIIAVRRLESAHLDHPEALMKFLLDHQDCRLKFLSEYNEMLFDYKTLKAFDDAKACNVNVESREK